MYNEKTIVPLKEENKMQYFDKLKKERSIDRVIFLAGMVLVFIGFLIPTIFVKQIVTETDLTVAQATEAVETAETVTEATDELSEQETLEEDELSEDALAETEEDDFDDLEYDEPERAFVHFASKKEVVTDFKKNYIKDEYGRQKFQDGEPLFEYVLDKDGNKIVETTTSYKYVVVEAEVEENDEGEKAVILGENGLPKLTYAINFDKDGNVLPDEEFAHVKPEDMEKDFEFETNHFNLFQACKVLNQAGLDYGDFDYIPGTAYNATFLVIVWLCSIAGIVLFFLTKTIIGDIVVVLLSIAFGLAATFSIPLTLSVAPIIGYYSVGGYFVLVGVLVSLAGSILGAAHVKHPSLPKAE